MTIWKFPLRTLGQQTVKMPMGAEILTCQMQGSQPCLWALVDPEEQIENRTIFVFGTGHKVDDKYRISYVATIQIDGGSLIFHVFQERR